MIAVLVPMWATATPVHAQEVAVVLVGGYGADLDEASAHFAHLRAALASRSPTAVIIQYSYTGMSFAGCEAAPGAYSRADTAQDIAVSKRILHETVVGLQAACPVQRIAVVGHSLGGLVAFEALAEGAAPGVSDLITVDSPMGGVPEQLVETCIRMGFCAAGAAAAYLAELYPRVPRIEVDNAARAAMLAESGIAVSAWGNEGDCFYNVGLCTSLARAVFGSLDARETQWLGMPNVVRKRYPVTRGLVGIGPSHTAVFLHARRQAGGRPRAIPRLEATLRGGKVPQPPRVNTGGESNPWSPNG